MDPILVRKIEKDEDYAKKLNQIVLDYLRLGRNARDYWFGEFDVAHDILMCYAPLTKADFDLLEKGHPRKFILPTTATQIETMTTFISQMLFGQDSPNKVEPRGAKDEGAAEHVNQLLRWNSEQQPTYLQGYLWIKDALTYNRAIFYNSWSPVFRATVESELVPDPQDVDENGEPKKFSRPRRRNKKVAGYCKRDLVSPYDFLCDPALPLHRMQEMRFLGHKTLIPWNTLQARTKLPVTDPAYLIPSQVEKLKEKNAGHTSTVPNAGAPVGDNSQLASRTQYQRQKAANPNGGQKADKADPGVFECYELWIRLCPDDYEIYGGADDKTEGGDEPTIFQFLMSHDIILGVNESTYAHGQFPYSVAEGRPNSLYQFSPSWLLLLKGIQDYVDWLKDKHQEALSRTIGNIFIADPTAVDLEDFLNPNKEGKVIVLKPDASGKKISDVFQQVPIRDMTEKFHEEIGEFVKLSESVTGANSNMQGQIAGGENSATEYAGTQQMGAGRMSAVARLLSVQGLVPQTRQFVENFQQFMDFEQDMRFATDRIDLPPELAGLTSLKISRDTIQGEFNMVAHDGSLPGVDSKKVAAISRVIEASATFPQLFAPAPGNLDIRKLIFAAAKSSGLNVENFVYTNEQLNPGGPPAGAPPTLPQIQPPSPGGPPGQPGPAPAAPTLPDIALDALASLGPKQPRPSSV